MPDHLELALAGAAIRVELADVGEPTSALAPAASSEDDADLPEGFSAVIPVARGRRAAVLAQDVLQSTLRPLGPLLEEVHTAVTATAQPPEELTVEFGIQIGQDLTLGIVGAKGHATMTVSATWQSQASGDASPA